MRIANLNKLILFGLAFFTLAILLPYSDSEAQQRRKKKESAKTALTITDYQWKSGGRGLEGILGSVTIENTGSKDYENIGIEVEFISSNDVPQGSLRTTINDNLISGAKKTFTNISLGVMNTELEKTVIRITGAEIVEIGIDSPEDVIIVKDWQWLETNYGTEGILEFITLENKSDRSFKKIELRIDYQGVGDSKAVPYRTVIHEYLPPKTEKTYNNINVGFKYRGARSAVITVTDAKKISRKEYRSILAKEGIKIEPDTPGIGDYVEYDETVERDRNLSLAERYRKYVLKIEPETQGAEDTAEQQTTPLPVDVEPVIEEQVQVEEYAYYRDESRYPKRVDNAISDEQLLMEQATIFPEVFQEIVIVSAHAEDLDSTENEKIYSSSDQQDNYNKRKVVYQYSETEEEDKNFAVRAFDWGKGLVGLGDDEEEYEEEYEQEDVLVETEVALNNQSTSSSAGVHPYTSVANVGGKAIEYESINEQDYPIEYDEDLEPLPRIDIEIRDYKIKPGIVSTIGQLDEITLVNKSSITYTNIQLEVTFYTRGATKQLGSNKFVINEILPKRTRRTFRNVEIGFLSTVPEELKIRVVDAIDIN